MSNWEMWAWMALVLMVLGIVASVIGWVVDDFLEDR